MHPPSENKERQEPVEDLKDFSPENATVIFQRGIAKAVKAFKLEGKAEIFSKPTGRLAKGLNPNINPIEYQNIYLIDLASKEQHFLGTILPEKEHLKTLKSSDEICEKINFFLQVLIVEKTAGVCKKHSPEIQKCNDFTLIDKTGGRVSVAQDGNFRIDGKRVDLDDKHSIKLDPGTDTVTFYVSEKDSRYIVIEMIDDGSDRKTYYHVDTAAGDRYKLVNGLP